MDRLLRARVLVAEAESLGVSLDDPVAAAAATLTDTADPVPTVSQYLAVIRPTFEKGTLQTYGTYWRLAEEMIGSRPIDKVTVDDCEAIVVEAGKRAQARRPAASGGPRGRTASPRCGRCSSGPSAPGSSRRARPPSSASRAGFRAGAAR